MADEAEDGSPLSAGEQGETASPGILQDLPEDFLRFLRANRVPLEAFSKSYETPRYVRANPRGPLASSSQSGGVAAIAAALGCERVRPVRWLPANHCQALASTVTQASHASAPLSSSSSFVSPPPTAATAATAVTAATATAVATKAEAQARCEGGSAASTSAAARGVSDAASTNDDDSSSGNNNNNSHGNSKSSNNNHSNRNGHGIAEEGGEGGDRTNDMSLLWSEVYCCPASTNLSRNEGYKKGHLYGVDAASIFAVRCLEPRPGDAILDLCCAPGAKLCTLADAVGPDGEVVGVDVAENRIAACRTMLNKYGITNAKLSLGDGTTWDPQTCTWFDLEPPPRGRGQRARKRKRDAALAEAAAQDPEAHQTSTPKPTRQFDRVLVDAECTHDASLRHVQKFGDQWGWETLGGRVPWVRQEEKLYELQYALLCNGYRLLKDGGTLIYSTCSLCQSQNEDIVNKFLSREPTAVMEALPLPLSPPQAADGLAGDFWSLVESSSAPARPGLFEGSSGICSARFDPRVSGTSGLFIARLHKRPALGDRTI